MAKQTIDLGTQGTQSGDNVRNAFDKANDNFNELYNAIQNVYYVDSQGLTYSANSTSYRTGSTLISSLPVGTYIGILTLTGTTSMEDTTGYLKLKQSSGDVGIGLKFSRRALGSLDGGNGMFTYSRVITITTAGAVYPQYRLISGTGSCSIVGLNVTIIKRA